jgi:hypothetical protein
MTKAIGWLVSMATGAAAIAAGVTTPITATMTMTWYEVDGNGQSTMVHQENGTFGRSSDGSEVTRWLDLNTHQPTTGVITAKGQSVSVKYASKQYRVSGSSPFAPYAIPFKLKPGMETQTINGVNTVANPIFDGKTQQIIGKNWFSPDYKINIRNESTTITPTGKTLRIVSEMSNVQVGVEPDPSLFTVPADFTPTAGSPVCSVCGGAN